MFTPGAIILCTILVMCGLFLALVDTLKNARTKLKRKRARKCRCESCKQFRRKDLIRNLLRYVRRDPEEHQVSNIESEEAETWLDGYGTFADWDGVGPAALTEMSYNSFDNSCKSDQSRESKYDPKWAHLSIDCVTPGSRIEFVHDTPSGPTERLKPTGLEEHTHVRWLQNKPNNNNKVRVMQHNPTGQLRVVKTQCVPYDQQGKPTVSFELEMMRDSIKPHASLVQFLGHELVEHNDNDSGVRRDVLCHIFLEYCEYGDLNSFMNRWDRYQEPYIPCTFLLHVWGSLSSALGYLHCGLREIDGRLQKEEGTSVLVHCDIKPQNVFLRWTPYCRHGLPDVVLGDFGLCLPYDSWRNRGACGTIGYQPPEVDWVSDALYRTPDEISFETYMNASKARYNRLWSPAGDVWAVGAVMAELVTLDSSRPISVLFNSDAWGKDFDDNFWISLEQMLHSDPDQRIKSAKLADWALKMKENVEYLYEKGERMPEDCWKSPEGEESSLSNSVYSGSTLRSRTRWASRLGTISTRPRTASSQYSQAEEGEIEIERRSQTNLSEVTEYPLSREAVSSLTIGIVDQDAGTINEMDALNERPSSVVPQPIGEIHVPSVARRSDGYDYNVNDPLSSSPTLMMRSEPWRIGNAVGVV